MSIEATTPTPQWSIHTVPVLEVRSFRVDEQMPRTTEEAAKILGRLMLSSDSTQIQGALESPGSPARRFNGRVSDLEFVGGKIPAVNTLETSFLASFVSDGLWAKVRARLRGEKPQLNVHFMPMLHGINSQELPGGSEALPTPNPDRDGGDIRPRVLELVG